MTATRAALSLPLPAGSPPDEPGDDLVPVLRRGLAVLVVGLGGFLAWAAWAPLDQALPGSGQVAVAGSRKAVQHPTGGTVAALAVHEGDRVRQGQVLVRLDMAPQLAELDAAERQLLLLGATRVRLSALLADAAVVDFDPALRRQAAALPGGERLLAVQRMLFENQRRGLRQGRDQHLARAGQLRAELAGQQQLLAQQKEQHALVKSQVGTLEELTATGFYPKLKLIDAQRQLGSAQQEASRSQAEMQRLRQALVEAEQGGSLQGSTARRDWELELIDTERQAAQLQSRIAGLRHVVGQAEVVAPVSGTVVGLTAHTVGGVIQAGQTVMEIVPADDALVVEARFPLAAGEKLHAGQAVDLRLSSLDQARTPVIEGQVLTVSADRLQDARSGEPYLLVRVTVPAAERDRLQTAGITLRAGLPVEVFAKLGERSLLAYLVKPLSDRLGHAFIE